MSVKNLRSTLIVLLLMGNSKEINLDSGSMYDLLTYRLTLWHFMALSHLPCFDLLDQINEKTNKYHNVGNFLKSNYIMLYPGRLVMSGIRTYNVIGNGH
jgi:hypothetical protein